MSEGAATAVAGRTAPATPGGEHVRRPKQWFNHAREYLEDPARAIGAAFELARWERDEKRAEILKRVKDAADSGAWTKAEEDEPETTAARASSGASATTRPGRATGDLTPAQAAQLRAQVAAFGRLARGLTVPAGLMTAAAAGDPRKPTAAQISAAFPTENEKADDDDDEDLSLIHI